MTDDSVIRLIFALHPPLERLSCEEHSFPRQAGPPDETSNNKLALCYGNLTGFILIDHF
jgi:hypothetical protein